MQNSAPWFVTKENCKTTTGFSWITLLRLEKAGAISPRRFPTKGKSGFDAATLREEMRDSPEAVVRAHTAA